MVPEIMLFCAAIGLVVLSEIKKRSRIFERLIARAEADETGELEPIAVNRFPEWRWQQGRLRRIPEALRRSWRYVLHGEEIQVLELRYDPEIMSLLAAHGLAISDVPSAEHVPNSHVPAESDAGVDISKLKPTPERIALAGKMFVHKQAPSRSEMAGFLPWSYQKTLDVLADMVELYYDDLEANKPAVAAALPPRPPRRKKKPDAAPTPTDSYPRQSAGAGRQQEARAA